MEFHQLRGFVAVVEQGSFSRAADHVHISQPALSMQVKTLEQELGEQLLLRSSREVSPTEAGQIVYRRARQVLELQGLVGADLEELRSLQRGHLTVACSDTIAEYVLAPALRGFVRRFPGIRLGIRNATSAATTELVTHGQVDLGLTSLPEASAGLTVEPILTFRDVAVVGRPHPLCAKQGATLAELAEYPLLLLETGTRSRRYVDQAFAARRLQPTGIMEVGSVSVQKALAGAGVGVAVVPDFAAPPRGGALCSAPIRELAPRTLGVIHRRSVPRSRAAATFLQMLRNSLI
jgi:DNA-binding transcriptional LysR family regulator